MIRFQKVRRVLSNGKSESDWKSERRIEALLEKLLDLKEELNILVTKKKFHTVPLLLLKTVKVVKNEWLDFIEVELLHLSKKLNKDKKEFKSAANKLVLCEMMKITSYLKSHQEELHGVYAQLEKCLSSTFYREAKKIVEKVFPKEGMLKNALKKVTKKKKTRVVKVTKGEAPLKKSKKKIVAKRKAAKS